MLSPDQNPNPLEHEITPDQLQVYSMVAGTIWMIVGALLIYFFHETGITQLLQQGQFILIQIAIGSAVGLAFGVAAAILIKRPVMQKVTDDLKVVSVLKNMNLSNTDILQISLIAGITEEFLFRGALQPILGLWVTAGLFVAIHGYFRFGTFAHVIFGAFMLALSAGFGYLFELSGIFAAMAAHAMYDYVVIRELQKD